MTRWLVSLPSWQSEELHFLWSVCAKRSETMALGIQWDGVAAERARPALLSSPAGCPGWEEPAGRGQEQSRRGRDLLPGWAHCVASTRQEEAARGAKQGGKARRFPLLTLLYWAVYETVVKGPRWYPDTEMAPAVPDHLAAGPDSAIPQIRHRFPLTLWLKTGIFFLPLPRCSSIVTEKTWSVLKQNSAAFQGQH